MRDIEIDDREGDVEQVSTDDVVRQWAEGEIEEEDVDIESSPPEELITSLEDRQELAESVFFEEDLEWYKIRLEEQELRNLLVVKGPEDEGWRAVADGKDIESIAKRLASADDIESLNEDVPKDVTYVRETAEDYGSGEELGPLIAVQESPDEPAHLLDGNHRAVAIVYHLLTGGEYTGQVAYIGLPPEEDSATLHETDRADDDHPAHG